MLISFSSLFFSFTFFFQFEEVFLETREQYEKLLQSEYIWDLKISVSRFCPDPEKKVEDCVDWLPHGREGIWTELWAAAETECFPHVGRHNWKLNVLPTCSFTVLLAPLFVCAAAKTLLAKIHLRCSFWLAWLLSESSALQQLFVSWT